MIYLVHTTYIDWEDDGKYTSTTIFGVFDDKIKAEEIRKKNNAEILEMELNKEELNEIS